MAIQVNLIHIFWNELHIIKLNFVAHVFCHADHIVECMQIICSGASRWAWCLYFVSRSLTNIPLIASQNHLVE